MLSVLCLIYIINIDDGISSDYSIFEMAKIYQTTTMSKRPLEDPQKTPPKRARRNEELEAMKAQLDSLLATAAEHHEETRISAVDEAYDLEEQLKGMQQERDEARTKLAEVTIDFETASKYVHDFQASQTANMLTKAAECTLDHVKVLHTDNTKIMQTLDKLKTFKQTMKTQQDAVSATLQELEGKCTALTSKFEAAEQRVEEITNLNEQ